MIFVTKILSHFRERFVRIFSNLIYLAFGILIGQDPMIKIPSIESSVILDSLYNKKEYDSNIALVYNLKRFQLNPDYSIYSIVENRKYIDSLVIDGVINIQNPIMDRIIAPLKSNPINNGFENIKKNWVQRYYFFRQEPLIELGLINESHLGAILQFSPEFESYFSGIFGLSQQGKNWYLNGEIDLHFENLIQTAGILDLYWKRTDSLSQSIQFEILEPHPFGWELGTHIRYHHEIMSGLYTIIKTESMLRLYSPWVGHLNLGFISGRTHPTKIGQISGFEKVWFKALSISKNTDTRNQRYLPTKGKKINISIDAGLQKKTEYIETEFDIQQYFEIWKKFNVMLRLQGKGLHDFKVIIPKSRYMIYGGSGTLRGFKEQNFSAPQFQVGTIELNYKPVNMIQTGIFIDCGTDKLNLFNNNNNVGYGLGFTQVSNKTIIKIQYAMAKGQNFSDGKLHINWISRI